VYGGLGVGGCSVAFLPLLFPRLISPCNVHNMFMFHHNSSLFIIIIFIFIIFIIFIFIFIFIINGLLKTGYNKKYARQRYRFHSFILAMLSFSDYLVVISFCQGVGVKVPLKSSNSIVSRGLQDSIIESLVVYIFSVVMCGLGEMFHKQHGIKGVIVIVIGKDI